MSWPCVRTQWFTVDIKTFFFCFVFGYVAVFSKGTCFIVTEPILLERQKDKIGPTNCLYIVTIKNFTTYDDADGQWRSAKQRRAIEIFYVLWVKLVCIFMVEALCG